MQNITNPLSPISSLVLYLCISSPPPCCRESLNLPPEVRHGASCYPLTLAPEDFGREGSD